MSHRSRFRIEGAGEWMMEEVLFTWTTAAVSRMSGYSSVPLGLACEVSGTFFPGSMHSCTFACLP